MLNKHDLVPLEQDDECAQTLSGEARLLLLSNEKKKICHLTIIIKYYRKASPCGHWKMFCFLQVTMADRASADRACKDPNPIIDGRKANVNLAYLGAKPRVIQPGEGLDHSRAAANDHFHYRFVNYFLDSLFCLYTNV